MLKDFRPEKLSVFQAYCRLTVMARVYTEQRGERISLNKEQLNFQDFLDALEKEEVVDSNLAREVDERMAMDYIQQAYRFGLVDEGRMPGYIGVLQDVDETITALDFLGRLFALKDD